MGICCSAVEEDTAHIIHSWRSLLRVSQLESSWCIDSKLQHSCITQIQKDLSRTFPQQPYFSEPTNLARLKTLLHRYSLCFPHVGYTQGINFLAGYLLFIGFSDRQAFEVLVSMSIHPDLLLIGLFEDTLPLSEVYSGVYWQLLTSQSPVLAQKIRQLQIPNQMWVFQWGLTLFMTAFPVQEVCRLWHYVITEKGMAVPILLYAITIELSAFFMKMQDLGDFQQLMKSLKDLVTFRKIVNLQKVIKLALRIQKGKVDSSIRSYLQHRQSMLAQKGPKNNSNLHNLQFLNDGKFEINASIGVMTQSYIEVKNEDGSSAVSMSFDSTAQAYANYFLLHETESKAVYQFILQKCRNSQRHFMANPRAQMYGMMRESANRLSNSMLHSASFGIHSADFKQINSYEKASNLNRTQIQQQVKTRAFN